LQSPQVNVKGETSTRLAGYMANEGLRNMLEVDDASDLCLWSLFCMVWRDLAQHCETSTTNLKSLRAKLAM